MFSSFLEKLVLIMLLKFPKSFFILFLQVLLTGFRSLPPLFEDTPNAVHELTVASKNAYSMP